MYAMFVVGPKITNQEYNAHAPVFYLNFKTSRYENATTLEQAKAAVDSYLAQQAPTLLVGYTAYVVDLDKQEVVATATKPPVPVAHWIDKF